MLCIKTVRQLFEQSAAEKKTFTTDIFILSYLFYRYLATDISDAFFIFWKKSIIDKVATKQIFCIKFIWIRDQCKMMNGRSQHAISERNCMAHPRLKCHSTQGYEIKHNVSSCIYSDNENHVYPVLRNKCQSKYVYT